MNGTSVLPRVSKPLPWLVACLVVLAVGVVLQPRSAFSGLLTASLFAVQLTVGALLWIALLSITGSKWWLPARKHFMAVASPLLVPAAIAATTAVAGMGTLYAWAQPGATEHSHLLHLKAGWLNPTFFTIRAIVVVVIWAGLTKAMTTAMGRWTDGSAKAQSTVAKLSALTLVLLALTISVAFWDWAMSLEPEWFSTMYGVYGFAGALQGGIAAVAALSIWRSRHNGRSRITANVRHDYGRLLFGFSMFWAYIWFCQFMLIWYANLPEEVGYYSARMSYSWGFLFWLNLILNFAVPFFVLLPAGNKRNANVLFQVSLLVVGARLLDVYLLIEPSLSEAPTVPIYHLVATILVFVVMLVKGSPARSPAR
jgi:hypothetical protein